MILDEATAFTDPENEDKIQRSIMALSRGKTLLVIAHRLSSVKNADQICVMAEGRIAARGTHDELLKASEEYRKLWNASMESAEWRVSGGKEER